MLRLVECRNGDMNGLFQHVLASDRGVHDLIGKAHPCRSRPEANDLLWAMLLIPQVRLGPIMQPQHEMIVVAAHALGHMEPCKRSRHSRKLRPDVRQKCPGHGIEILAHPPYPILARMHIGEHTQDTLPMIWPGWKSVDMQSRIVLAPGQRPSNRGLRSKAGAGLFDIGRIAGQQARHHPGCAMSEARYQACQSREITGCASSALEFIAVEADVLSPVVGPLGREEALLVGSERESEMREYQH